LAPSFVFATGHDRTVLTDAYAAALAAELAKAAG